jgi:hypothetical protein
MSALLCVSDPKRANSLQLSTCMISTMQDEAICAENGERIYAEMGFRDQAVREWRGCEPRIRKQLFMGPLWSETALQFLLIVTGAEWERHASGNQSRSKVAAGGVPR